MLRIPSSDSTESISAADAVDSLEGFVAWPGVEEAERQLVIRQQIFIGRDQARYNLYVSSQLSRRGRMTRRSGRRGDVLVSKGAVVRSTSASTSGANFSFRRRRCPKDLRKE